MKSRIILLSGILTAAIGVMLPLQLQAAKVLHHGVAVEEDATSRECLACHDGASANNVSFCTVRCGFDTSHSVEKHYPPIGKAHLYAPAALLRANGIKLINGNVTCVSCHNLKKNDRYHLVMDNSHSQLCLTCHIRK